MSVTASRSGAKRERKVQRRGLIFSGMVILFIWAVTLTVMAGLGFALFRAHDVYSAGAADTAAVDSAMPLLEPVLYEHSKLQASRKVAIIIDDLGGDLAVARKVLEMKVPLTLAVLPYQTGSYEVALEAARRGRQVILHLPLQPRGYPALDPGPGSLLVYMDRAKMQTDLDVLISSLPACVGVSNHMGSLFTEKRQPMTWVFSVLRERNLFFVDSLVTPDSVAREVAESLGVRFAARTHFLDEKRDEDLVVRQLCRLADYAARQGVGLGVGHPYPETLAAIPKALSAFAEKGVEIVPVSEIVFP